MFWKVVELVFNNKKEISVQEWLLVDKILENGIVKLKNGSYIKIIEVITINYSLKSELEKEAILNSFKIFLKSANFDFQILVQSNKQDLSKHISSVKNSTKSESKCICEIAEDYINYLNYLNSNKNSATKKFFIILKKERNIVKKNERIESNETVIFDELNDEYMIVKDTLSRCGNVIYSVNSYDAVLKVIKSFL